MIFVSVSCDTSIVCMLEASRSSALSTVPCVDCVWSFSFVQAWYFARDKLTYMRELGEGEFGKVLLMQAKVRQCMISLGPCTCTLCVRCTD